MKLGMLGMWHTHADGIVRQVAEHPDEFTLVGFYDADPAVVAKRREQWGPQIDGFRVFDKPEQLLAEPLDGVVVEGRVYENLALARLALESGRPVMLEKPAGDRLDEYRQLVDLAQRKHLHVQMIYLFRYMSAVQEMLRRARAGELGRIYEFRARLPKDLPSYDRFVEELKHYKGGMFFEMAGHVIDMMVAILGKPKKVTPFLGAPSRARATRVHRQRRGGVRLRPRLGDHRGAGAGSGPALAPHRGLRDRGRLRDSAPGERPPGEQEHPADRGLSRRRQGLADPRAAGGDAADRRPARIRRRGPEPQAARLQPRARSDGAGGPAAGQRNGVGQSAIVATRLTRP